MAFYTSSTHHCASCSYWDRHSSGFLPLHLLYLQPRAVNNVYFQAGSVFRMGLSVLLAHTCAHVLKQSPACAVRHHPHSKAQNTPGNYVARFP